MVNIKVAVRIRPLSQREIIQREEIIVRKENKFVLVTNPKVPERQDGDARRRTRRFGVDFCYDPKEDPEGSSQEAVYKEIGSEVLDSMFDGYNACMLAYGHSASGKTYTIMGWQEDPGLTPRLCRGLFERLGQNSCDKNIRVRVVISFLEIYNEKVKDLLGSEDTGVVSNSFSLRVREHPKLGPYVQGLSEHLVGDIEKLLGLLERGNRRRSTAATENNIHSSRSHAVFTIRFHQSDGEKLETEKSSKVHLVDLAGSERANSSQSKARLKEGANINKSLVTLGNVISALAESHETNGFLKEHSGWKTWQPFVPYRDSVLTWLLKDTLGGNSNTIMIATISPASSCFNETVNTLRYAKRTKRIVNRPIINEDPKIRTIRELRKEIARLEELLLSFVSGSVSSPKAQAIFFLSRRTSSDSKEALGPFVPQRKWPEPEDTPITILEECQTKEESEEKIEECEAEQRINSSASESDGCVRWRRTYLPREDAYESNDEKESDVNSSVNDTFSHETQVFSDSLESFSSVFFGKGNPWGIEVREAREVALCPRFVRELNSRKNLRKTPFSRMLHRSRPDLIKGISTRSKEGLPSTASHSCTDVSNLSQSTSENSLNSSGSVDVQPSDNRSSVQEEKEDAGRSKSGSEASRVVAKKTKDKRTEIVEAVTTRLYVAKKKPNHQVENLKKKEDEGELEELKLCKRARMKLFDLSRKLALTRKAKKTVDNETQTDHASKTIRVKEKCVETDPKEASDSEGEEDFDGEPANKGCVIMNQVFIPGASEYVVECGKSVRIETSKASARHESATQTGLEESTFKNANTSPIEFSPRDEDSFSDDSLDTDRKNQKFFDSHLQENKTPAIRVKPKQNENLARKECREEVTPKHICCNFEKPLRGKAKAMAETLFTADFVGEPFYEKKSILAFVSGLENVSRESSSASFGTAEDIVSSSSSEEFVYCENLKDITPQAKANDRELYTITENSEQSDPSDAFSPIPSQDSSPDVTEGCKSSREGNPKVQKRLKGRGFFCGDETEAKAAEPLQKTDSKNLRFSDLVKTNNNFSEIFGGVSKSSLQEFQPKKRKAFDSTVPNPVPVPNAYSIQDLKYFEEVPNVESKRKDTTATKKKEKKCWADFQCNSENQYLNLNISKGESKTSFFTVDTHLFERNSKEDASFPSADSVTFVFMGRPAESKTSVLMELIGRSLGKMSFSSALESNSKGVQCDATLMRSVSTDTAFVALSKIAKNQEWSSAVSRTTSLDALSSDELQTMSGRAKCEDRRETSCQCDFDVEDSEAEKKKGALKYSVGTNTVSHEGTQTGREGTEKPRAEEKEQEKKSVSWSESDRESSSELKDSDFVGRRVRFSKSETWPKEDHVTAFLKEAIQLLKSINSSVSDERLRGLETELNEEEEKSPNRGATINWSGKERCWVPNPEIEENFLNSTWPRRRAMRGKPPTGTRAKFSRGSVPSRSNCLPDWSGNPTRTDSSDFPVARVNFCLEEPSISLTSEPSEPKSSFGPVSNSETGLKTFYRRLEIAADEELNRGGGLLKNEEPGFEWEKSGGGLWLGSGETKKKEFWADPRKRREAGGCTGGCTCGSFARDPCKHFLSKGCQSSFELDSYGPGSNHCHQFCMFCRKKDAELYSSALSLNSECRSGFCRLNYYGYCPCSSVRLSHVSSSPRAYMQHLLTLRRQIVGRRKPA